jgi:hypothetical protein
MLAEASVIKSSEPESVSSTRDLTGEACVAAYGCAKKVLTSENDRINSRQLAKNTRQVIQYLLD